MIPAIQQQAFQGIVRNLTGWLTIWADQDAPQPQKPFIVLRVISRHGPDYAEYMEVGEDGLQQVREHVYATVEVQGFGEASFTKLEELRLKLKWYTTKDACYLANIAICERSVVTDVSALMSPADWEERAMLEVGVGYRYDSLDDVSLIETVNIEADMYPHIADTIVFQVEKP